MKQTNNAIKFLMAQYRAIFKNANIAMVAAMVASALAAGQAQAAADNTKPENIGSTELADNNLDNKEEIKLESGDKAVVLEVSNANAVNVNSGGKITLTDAANGHIFTKNDLVVNSGGAISLTGSTSDKADVAGLVGAASDTAGQPQAIPTASLTINKGGKLDVTSSFAMIKDVNLNGTVNISGSTGKNTADAQSGEYLKYAAVYAETGTLTVGKDAAVTLGAASHLYGRDVVVNDGTIAFSGDTAAGKDGSANSGGALLRAGDSKNGGSLTINGGTLSVAASKFGDIVGTTINMTGGELKVDGTLGLSNNYHDKAKTARMTVTGDAQITGSGAFNLANKAVLTVDKAILDNFVKDNSTGGKFTFSGPGTQITIKNDKAVDLSQYTYGSGTGADFDVTKDSVIGKIKGESLAITKDTAGTLSSGTKTGIKVEANNLSLGSADAEAKLSKLSGSVFTQLTAHDKLTLAGKGDKFTIDQGDMFLTNTSATEVSVIDGADINFETGRIQIKGSWTTDSDITFTGGPGTSNANIYFGNASGVTNSLTLSGTIKNDKAANTWGGINVGAAKNDTTLDVTNATFASTGNAGSLVTLAAADNGIVKITGAQASDILAAKDNTKGFALGVQEGGTLAVQGELKADFGDFVEFNSTGTVIANKLFVGANGSNGVEKHGGTLVADKINIAASGDTLTLHKASIKSADITLGNGTLKSGSVVATSKLNLGEFTLGDSGAFALDGKGTVSGTTLTVNGTNAAVNVDGSWTLNSGLTTTAGTVTVDNESMLYVSGALDVKANTVDVKNGSTLKADYADATATTGLGTVKVDATSHLELTNYDKASMGPSIIQILKAVSKF